jgi:hypothetical protein
MAGRGRRAAMAQIGELCIRALLGNACGTPPPGPWLKPTATFTARLSSAVVSVGSRGSWLAAVPE